MNGQHPLPRHCVVPNCPRYAAAGSVVCWPHRKTRTGRKWDATVRLAVEDAGHAVEGGDDSAAAEKFRRRLARGQYRELFDAPLMRILNQAAGQSQLDDELGAVRYALARLLAEEADASRLALGVARLAHASVATSRERRESAPPKSDGLTEAMTRVLKEIEEQEELEAATAPTDSVESKPPRLLGTR